MICNHGRSYFAIIITSLQIKNSSKNALGFPISPSYFNITTKKLYRHDMQNSAF